MVLLYLELAVGSRTGTADRPRHRPTAVRSSRHPTWSLAELSRLG